MRTRYEGTLFRFPLRSPEQGAVSRLSRQTHDVESIRKLLKAFVAESGGMLLFLKNVERMSVLEWAPGDDAPVAVRLRGSWDGPFGVEQRACSLLFFFVVPLQSDPQINGSRD